MIRNHSEAKRATLRYRSYRIETYSYFPILCYRVSESCRHGTVFVCSNQRNDSQFAQSQFDVLGCCLTASLLRNSIMMGFIAFLLASEGNSTRYAANQDVSWFVLAMPSQKEPNSLPVACDFIALSSLHVFGFFGDEQRGVDKIRSEIHHVKMSACMFFSWSECSRRKMKPNCAFCERTSQRLDASSCHSVAVFQKVAT